MSFKPWFFENQALPCLFKASAGKESANKAAKSCYFLQGGLAAGQAEGAGQQELCLCVPQCKKLSK